MRNFNKKTIFLVVLATALLFVSAVFADTVCIYNLSPKSKGLSAKAASASVRVKTKPGCAWTASSSESWLTITSGESGTGTGSVKYSAEANTVTSSRMGTITIAEQAFTVTQAAGSPRISVKPAAVSLGTVEIGSESAVKEVTIKNTGTADLSISSVAISGTNEGEFTIESNTCSSELTVGSTCSVSVILTPESKGVKNAALAIISGDPARPSLSLKLKGTGKAPVDRSTKYAKDIFNLYKNARLGTISDEDFLDQLSAVLSAIDSAPGGPQYFEDYLNKKILGSKFTALVKAENKVSKSSTWDDIKNSEAWLVITTFVSTVADALAMEFVPGGDALSVAMQPELAAASNTTWITVTDVSSDGILSTSGPGFVAFVVDANTKSSERAGSIFIAGKSFAVTRKGTESEDDTSPFSGSLSGDWSGSCTIEGYTDDASGTFQMTISPSGAVTGSYGGDDSGSISGSVKTGGSFTAAGSAGGVSWSGSFSVSGTAMSGSGSWKGGGCSGGWSGTGTATE